MGQRESRNTPAVSCKSCGEFVQVAGTVGDDHVILCVRCAIEAVGRRHAQEPDQRQGSQHTPDERYEPSERELQWWRFLAWMIATGRLTVGPDEGVR